MSEQNHKKVVYAFNNFYLNFITDIKKSNEFLKREVKKNFKVFDKSDSEYFSRIRECFNMNQENQGDIELLPKVTLNTILEQVEDKERNAVMNYMHIFKLMLLVDAEDNETVLVKVLDVIKTLQDTSSTGENIEEKMKEIIDDDILNILKELKHTLSIKDTTEDLFSMLENSQIGSLAKEISNEININELNLSNPEQLLDFRNLTNSNNVLGNIISKVSTKIQDKIQNGQLSQSDLVNEALSFVGKMNGGSGSGGISSPLDLLNNPMFSEMMKSFTTDKNTKVQVDQNKVRSMETRERLKAKLEKKKNQSKM